MTPIHIGRAWEIDPRELSIRPFAATPADYNALASVRNATLKAITLPDDYHERSAEDMERYYYRADFSLAGNAWLLFHGEKPAAAAVIYPAVIFTDRPPGNFDMYVAPEFGRHGIGSRLMAHLMVAAVQRGHRVLETTVARENGQSTGFLMRHGFNVVSHSMHFVRDDMSSLPQVTLPPGYSIKSLTDLQEQPDLYMETANRLGAYDQNYTLIGPEELEKAVNGPSWKPDGVLFLLEGEERIAGLIRADLNAQNSRKGYLHEIRLDTASRKQGLGTAMVAAALHYLADNGAIRSELDIAGENTAAHSLATRSGFKLARHWLHYLKPMDSMDGTDGLV